MKKAGLAVLTAVLCACGQGSGSPSGPAAQAFLAEVHTAAPDVGGYRTDTQLVRLGGAACDGFAAGASFEQLADRLVLAEGSKALPSTDLGAVITAAADALCPRYKGRV